MFSRKRWSLRGFKWSRCTTLDFGNAVGGYSSGFWDCCWALWLPIRAKWSNGETMGRKCMSKCRGFEFWSWACVISLLLGKWRSIILWAFLLSKFFLCTYAIDKRVEMLEAYKNQISQLIWAVVLAQVVEQRDSEWVSLVQILGQTWLFSEMLSIYSHWASGYL